MNEKFAKFHWEFFLNNDGQVEVYETRSGDVIGCIPDFDLKYIEDYVEFLNEQHVYEFIESVIEYY